MLGADETLQSEAIAHINRLSAVDTVRARIALAIKYGLLAPGDRLPHDTSIAQGLDVSVMTARRALVLLADDGIVVRKRGKAGGTFVAQEPNQDVVEGISSYSADLATIERLIDERTIIETALVAAASVRPQPEVISTLQGHIDQAAAASDWAEYHRADEAFHLGLADASGLDWAKPVHADVLTRLYRYFLPYPIEYLRESNAEHQKILDAIAQGDTQRAISECQAHILILHETMFTGLQQRQSGHGRG